LRESLKGDNPKAGVETWIFSTKKEGLPLRKSGRLLSKGDSRRLDNSRQRSIRREDMK
jgi:hypothetical protein